MPVMGYFDTVFGVDGDLTPVPDALQVDGTVSFDQGYPIGYEIAPGSPGSLPIERDKMNYLFNQITAALQQYQQHSTAPFITSTMNGGSPFSYSKYDRVLNGGVVYQSLINSNTDTPPTSNWAIPTILSSSGTSILKGDGSGGIANATAGTEYLAPAGNGSALTGITASQISGLTPFVSSGQTITLAGSLTIAHGLGAQPKMVNTRLQCISTEGGYSVNDIVYVSNQFQDASNNQSGASIVADATNLYIKYNSTGFGAGGAYSIPRKDTGAVIQLTNSKWNAYFVATLY